MMASLSIAANAGIAIGDASPTPLSTPDLRTPD